MYDLKKTAWRQAAFFFVLPKNTLTGVFNALYGGDMWT